VNPVESLPFAARTQEAAVLMAPLVQWLRSTRRLRAEAGVFLEFPWAGRRVDVVTVGKRLRTSAFELKLGSIGRALEQAIYNREVFDRSYIVVGHLPSQLSLREAAGLGIGVVLVHEGRACPLQESPFRRPHAGVRRRLLRSVRTRSPWEPLL